MTRSTLGLAAGALLATIASACGGGSSAEVAPTPSAPNAPATSIAPTASGAPVTSIGPTSTTRPLPPLPGAGDARAVVTRTGVVAPVVAAKSDGSFVVVSPCGNQVSVRGARPIGGAHVVLDPGHGGGESGAVGPTGLKESVLNLAVAAEVQRELAAAGVQVVLTRTADYRITLASRARIATSLAPAAFVSIHHNAEPDHTQATPGTEIYYQVGDDRSSKRLAGLVYDETVSALAPYKVTWGAFRDAGVKVRTGSAGGDYYGILRNTAGTPSALAELSYVTNAPEEALLKTTEFRAVEARAVARGILRFLTTDDPGRGFVGPSDRTEPAGPGGGGEGCQDPPLS